jgi:S-disulfanyl-L-cysteine oxidoreductase SoxD
MCSWASLVAFCLLTASAAHAQTQTQTVPTLAGIGRVATPAEVAAWDIDVRADFKGLPAGRGSVAQGQLIWDAQCASCHGVFGESNEVFTPLTGGTTADDLRSGRVARLNDNGFPGRSTFMKLATLSTLWDYIRRAMPWNAPKTLTVDEVYAVTAHLLHLADVLPEHFVLSDQNIKDVQQRLPNREGMSTAHAMWPGGLPGSTPQPDVQATACMKNCGADVQVVSRLPDFARNAHGNLAEQNRLVGPQRGAHTEQPLSARPVAAALAGLALAQQHNCLACHALQNKVVGPAFVDAAKKHGARADGLAYLQDKILNGSTGVWGRLAMPAQTLPGNDALAIAQWLMTLAPGPTSAAASK